MLCFIANRIFKQEWVVFPDSEKEEHEEPSEKKSRRHIGHLDYAMPNRKAIRTWVENFSLMSYTDMAESIDKAKSNNQIVTYGSDDTIKAAGVKRHDIKTGHVTIIGEDKSRESFFAGFYPNISHSGADAAKTVKHDIAKMAVLTGNSFQEMKDMIDYFMNDRAGDGETMLDELEIEATKRLKCNAHILLAIDVGIDKVFKDTETLIGVSNLIAEGASHVFNAPKNSVWYLGLIALAKLLSSSHNAESISLHTEYKNFLKADSISGSNTSGLSYNLLKQEFKGFISNRFGRLGELSAAIINHMPLLDKFFQDQVDEHANKLVLAVSCYKESEWFVICSEIANYFYINITLPIKELIGIDQFKDKEYSGGRSWKAVKEKMTLLLNTLKDLSQRMVDTAKDKLIGKVAKQIEEAITRQLNVMNFFRDEDSSDDIPQTPLTNLGCESEFASVGNDFKRSGGSTSLQTVSNKHIIARNRLFNKDRWTMLDDLQKRRKWKWARGSEQAKTIKEMETNFYQLVNAVQKLAVRARQDKKKRIQLKLMENLEKCKLHGGPLTASDLTKLSDLTYDQAVIEAGYLKKTVASNIRFKRKVGNKFVKFSEEELKQQIRDAIQPKCDVTKDVEELLLSVMYHGKRMCINCNHKYIRFINRKADDRK